MVSNDLYDPGATKPSEHLGIAVFTALLRHKQCVPYVVFDNFREAAQVVTARSNPNYRCWIREIDHRKEYIVISP